MLLHDDVDDVVVDVVVGHPFVDVIVCGCRRVVVRRCRLSMY